MGDGEAGKGIGCLRGCTGTRVGEVVKDAGEAVKDVLTRKETTRVRRLSSCSQASFGGHFLYGLVYEILRDK